MFVKDGESEPIILGRHNTQRNYTEKIHKTLYDTLFRVPK
jgi:hypothetical protein